MEQQLSVVELKSGEKMTVLKIVAPAPAWKERIVPFLAHKGEPWMWAVGEGLDHGVEPATMNFFEGVLEDGTIAGNITTVESLEPPLGLLQHVFTPEEHRRKGVCSALMTALTEDFTAREGRAMFLHTGYDSAAYHIYHSFGFEGYRETGTMYWVREQGFREKLFAPRATSVRDTHWGDWAPLEPLVETEDGWHVRSVYLGQYGFSGFEGNYLTLRRAMMDGPVHQVKVLEAEGGAIVGYALIADLRGWPGSPGVLDFFVHPDFLGDGEKLLAATDVPEGRKVLAFADSASDGKADMLEGAGFELEATLKRQMSDSGGRELDLLIFSRHA